MTTTISTEIDWEAADRVAAGLGLHTRRLAADGDAEPAREWALRMSRENNGVRAISYYELAVMLGLSEPARKDVDWRALLWETQKLVAAVKTKADEEARVVAEAGGAEDETAASDDDEDEGSPAA